MPIFPKPLSPRAHRRFDTLAAPGLLAAAALTVRRDPAAAAVMAVIAAGEGAAMLTTDYPPSIAAGVIDLRQHIAIADLHAGFIAALALFAPGVGRRRRPLLLALAGVPLLLNALTRLDY